MKRYREHIKGMAKAHNNYGASLALIKLVYFLSLLICTPSLHGENLYVTPEGAGLKNGADWNNAFAGFSNVTWGEGVGKLGEGDSLWIGGGIYNDFIELKGSGTAGKRIVMNRAVASRRECNSAAGWNAGYDSQVIINPPTWGIFLENSSPSGPGRYITIDGQEKDGIRINLVQTPLAAGIAVHGQGSFKTTFRNIGIYGPATASISSGIIWLEEVQGIQLHGYTSNENWSASDVYPSDITVEYCTIAGLVTAIQAAYTQGITIQHCNIHTLDCELGEPHGNVGWFTRCIDFVFRYNEVHDATFAVGLFFTYFGNNGVPSRNVQIYGNIFRDSVAGADRCIEVREESPGEGPFYIYNNTFVNVNQGINIKSDLYTESASYIVNNLFVQVEHGEINIEPGFESHLTINNNVTTSDYSNFKSPGSKGMQPEPFSWQWTRDLHLKAKSDIKGKILDRPYNIDCDGFIRGADGYWDIGAYEYSADKMILQPPINMRIVQ
jgi:hypothetical protein